MNLTQHPLSCAFPSMSADDFQALKDDIDVNGQREPVMVYEGMVLDGWHRYRACTELGIKPTQFNFTEGDPVAFVKSVNLHRRHLTGSQRAAAVVACSAWHPAHRGKKVEPGSTFLKLDPVKKSAPGADLSKTDAQMAKEAGVAVRTVGDVKAAGKAGLIDAVRDGALTAKEAAKIARGTPAQPKKAKQPAPWDKPPEPTLQPALDDAREAVHILSEENERLSDRLAVEAMDASEEERSQAKDTIESLRAEVKTLKAELSAVKASRDAYMRENGAMKTQCASQRRLLDKLKQAA